MQRDRAQWRTPRLVGGGVSRTTRARAHNRGLQMREGRVMTSRRRVLGGMAGAAAGLLTGCGNGGAAGSSELASGPATSGGAAGGGSGQALAAATPTHAYRPMQRKLFQAAAAKVVASRLPGGTDFVADGYGPSALYVDTFSGWPWDRAGGDWLDANLVRYGAKPWFKVPTVAATPATVMAYAADVTAALKFVQQQDRWCAFLLRSPTVGRKVAGLHHPAAEPPLLEVTYEDGSSARLRCLITAALTSGIPDTASAVFTLPVFLEFERPERAVRSAQLRLVVTEHWGSVGNDLEGFVLDPPAPQLPVDKGVADGAAAWDVGLDRAPGIIGVHRYTDGLGLGDFVHPSNVNTSAEREFDPALWGGPSDTTKLPHRGLGKWFNTNTDPAQWSMVDSSYRGDGFQPLGAGIGAMRFRMPPAADIGDGAVVGYGGGSGGNASIFMPEPLFGRLDRLFVRYYLRIGTPVDVAQMSDVRRRYQVYHDSSKRSPVWTDRAGKFGITPDHTTSYGGTSGSSGMGYGWQMRLAWAECDAGTSGPDEAGWRPGMHLFDFSDRQPPGHNYSTGPKSQMYWGQRGGFGGMLYVNRWYCIETELKLNSVSSDAPGYTPDGELRAWLDGRLVYERTGMVFRALPLYAPAADPARIRPCRELGVRALWFNWYHGGTTANSIDRSLFVTGLAWGRQYIGPMRMA